MKTKIITLLLLLIPLSSFSKLIEIKKSIIINEYDDIVFKIVKNTMNDYIWRTEVNDMSADGPFEVGTIFREDARIVFNKNFITHTQLVDIKENSYAYYITPESEKYYLSSHRQVERLDEKRTKFTYTVKFDPNMSKKAMKIKISPKIMKLYYSAVIKKYLKNLKNYFE